jgi:TonB family protein
MEKGSHLLRLISRPNFVEISFNDVQPFEKKYIARSIQVGINGRIRLKLHVEVLETAENFNALNDASPDGAQLIPDHRADAHFSWLTGELMRGQLLNKVSPQYPQAGLSGNLVLKVHVDATGAVDSEEVLRSENQILKAPVLAAVKQWRFRVSYQSDKVVPADYIFMFYYGGDDAGEESP